MTDLCAAKELRKDSTVFGATGYTPPHPVYALFWAFLVPFRNGLDVEM